MEHRLENPSLSTLRTILRSLPAALLVAALTITTACAPDSTSPGQDSRTPHPNPIVGAGPSPAAPSPSPSPTSVYGCPTGPCPRSLDYAVNGCTCAGQTYDGSQVTAQFCCRAGFSDSECPESLQLQALAESTFGATADEVEAHLVVVELQGWPAQVHEKAAAAFAQVAAKIDTMNYQILDPIGSYNRRDIEGRQVLSLHSFGIAVDINPSTNPSCGVTEKCRCFNDLVTDMPPEFVQAFKDAGFDWGGDWVEHPDPMHFEWTGWRHKNPFTARPAAG